MRGVYRKQILSTQLRAIKIALRHPLKLHPSKTLPPKWIDFGNESSLVVKHILVGQVQFFCFSSTSHAYLFACIKLHLCLSTASHINHQQVRHSTSVFFIASYVYIYIFNRGLYNPLPSIQYYRKPGSELDLNTKRMGLPILSLYENGLPRCIHCLILTGAV